MATYNAYQSQPYPYNTTGVPAYYSNWQYNPTYTQPQYQQLTQPVQNQSQPVQTAQTAQILADNANQTNALEQYLAPVPRPAYIVANPNGCNCGNNFGCGCGSFN